MFDPGPSDFNVLIFFLIISFIISILIYSFFKKMDWAFFSFSVLSNVSFYILKNTLLFWKYNILWLKHFSINYWPWLNGFLLTFLIIKWFRKRRLNSKENGKKFF